MKWMDLQLQFFIFSSFLSIPSSILDAQFFNFSSIKYFSFVIQSKPNEVAWLYSKIICEVTLSFTPPIPSSSGIHKVRKFY